LERIFAHRFNWSRDQVNDMPLHYIGAFMHDFEADGARAEAQREGYTPDPNQRVIYDPRVPLRWRSRNPVAVDAKIRQWNKAHPDEPPIPPPDIRPV